MVSRDRSIFINMVFQIRVNVRPLTVRVRVTESYRFPFKYKVNVLTVVYVEMRFSSYRLCPIIGDLSFYDLGVLPRTSKMNLPRR